MPSTFHSSLFPAIRGLRHDGILLPPARWFSYLFLAAFYTIDPRCRYGRAALPVCDQDGRVGPNAEDVAHFRTIGVRNFVPRRPIAILLNSAIPNRAFLAMRVVGLKLTISSDTEGRDWVVDQTVLTEYVRAVRYFGVHVLRVRLLNVIIRRFGGLPLPANGVIDRDGADIVSKVRGWAATWVACQCTVTLFRGRR